MASDAVVPSCQEFRADTLVDGLVVSRANWRPLTPYGSASIMHYPQRKGPRTA